MEKVIEWILKTAGLAVSIGVLLVAVLFALSFFLNPQGFTFLGLRTEPRNSASLPDGAIIAVRGACPSPGWKQSDDLTGRYLVAANPSGGFNRPSAQLDTVIGSYTATLRTENLPPHVHKGTTQTGKISREDWYVSYAAGGEFFPNVATGYNPNHVNPPKATAAKGAPGMDHFHAFETNESVGQQSEPFQIIPESFVVSFCEQTDN